MKTRICVVCGAEVVRERFRAPLERTACNLPKSCRNKLIAQTRQRDYAPMRREGNPNWQGGVMISWGYVYLLKPEHPRANKKGYVKRADLVLEKKIGRVLVKGEIAHHKDGDKMNDLPKNLELKVRGAHQRLHTAERKARGSYKGAQKHRAREKGRFLCLIKSA